MSGSLSKVTVTFRNFYIKQADRSLRSLSAWS